jgi:hypothetical protein
VADAIAREFTRFVAAQRRSRRLPAVAPARAAGETAEKIVISAEQAAELMGVAARRASGLFGKTKRTQVVWVEGESELAVSLTDLRVKLAEGLITVFIPVVCDQTGAAVVEVLFACGMPDQPAGLYAATPRHPAGPELIVATWGDALVAFAWQCLLGMIAGVAGATGKDQRGNVLVPVELVVTARTIEIVPMGRHRFAGSSGLKPTTGTLRP